MKIFLDSADIKQIEHWKATGILDGVTTNPSSLSKINGDVTKAVKEIVKALPHGEVSIEVTEIKPDAMYKQAHKIAKLGSNVIVKIPCHAEYYPVIEQLVRDEVPLNITLVFTLVQALMMCKLGVTYLSFFVGRLDDNDASGTDVLYEIRSAIDLYGYDTQILAASLRTVRHLHGAISAGCDAATLSHSVLEKAVSNLLTDQGIETFAADWKKAGIKQFP